MLKLKNLQVTRAAAVLVDWARANIIFKRFVTLDVSRRNQNIKLTFLSGQNLERTTSKGLR